LVTWCEEENQRQKELEEEANRKQEDDGGSGGSSGKKEPDPLEKMIGDPMKMMKGNFAFMIQNMVMMQAIQHFFSGFLLLKIPFSLTRGFKPMFQRGLVDMPDLHPSYVSSVSWYFLVMYGLRSFFQLSIGEPNLEMKEQEPTLQKLGKTMMQHGPTTPTPSDYVKQLNQEAEHLELLTTSTASASSSSASAGRGGGGGITMISFSSASSMSLDTVEKRLLGKSYPKKKVLVSDPTDFLMTVTSTIANDTDAASFSTSSFVSRNNINNHINKKKKPRNA
jgi:hypothetical protein